MPDHAKMYAILCGYVSDALDYIENGASLEEIQFILKKALLHCEDIYIADSVQEETQGN